MKLHSSPVKVVNVPLNKSYGNRSKIQNVLYSVATDMDWTSPGVVWKSLTGTGSGAAVPTSNDDVYIRKGFTVYMDGLHTSFLSFTSINNLYNAGNLDSNPFVASGKTLGILGDIQSTGGINFTSAAGQQYSLVLFGNKNKIVNYTPASNSIIAYCSAGTQEILSNVPYRHLTISSSESSTLPAIQRIGIGGYKYPNGSISITGNLLVGSNAGVNNAFGTGSPLFDTLGHGLTVGGSTTQVFSDWRCSGKANYLFIGAFDSSSSTSHANSWFGNPDIEFRHDAAFGSPNGASFQNFGSGNWLFSTSSPKTLYTGAYTINIDATCLISSGVQCNVFAGSTFQFTSTINGLSGTSNLTNKGTVNFLTAVAAGSMSTGVFDKTGFVNIIGYTGNYTANMHTGNFSWVTIGGTGTKSLAANASIAGNLTFNASGLMDLSTFDLTVNGATNLNIAGTKMIKTGAGSVLFVGRLTASNASSLAVMIDFRVGNPSVECRGGLTFGSNSSVATIQGGSGTWSFTTNSQTFTVSGSGAGGGAIFNNISVVGAITITSTGTAVYIEGTMNGTAGGSTFINSTSALLAIGSTTQPMSTGVLTLTSVINTFRYYAAGSFNLWHSAYWNLEILGAGTKTAVGNLSTTGTLYVGTDASISTVETACHLELSTYNLSVGGLCVIKGRLLKSGAGSVLFIGYVRAGHPSTSLAIDFTGGNPSVEVRAGIAGGTNAGTTIVEGGSGTWTFNTGNQTWEVAATVLGASPAPMNIFDFLISGAIVINTNGNHLLIGNSLNGNNVLSELENRGTVEYKGAGMPMSTGVLDANAAANTFKYNASGNQSVKGGNYRTLELGGSGIKQLQGNVDWITAYSLTGTASVDLNGFTLS
jgi:hypothetical protein